MAKNEKPVSNKASKMTVMILQYEGSDETLKEGFRTVSNAIDKLAGPVVRVVGTQSGRTLPSSKESSGEDSQVFEGELAEEESETTEQQAGDRTKTAKASYSGLPRQPKILDLDLKAGTTPLKEYLEQKSPSSRLLKNGSVVRSLGL